jgi:hypothetical protein
LRATKQFLNDSRSWTVERSGDPANRFSTNAVPVMRQRELEFTGSPNTSNPRDADTKLPVKQHWVISICGKAIERIVVRKFVKMNPLICDAIAIST